MIQINRNTNLNRTLFNSSLALFLLLCMGVFFKLDNEVYPIHEWRKFDSLSIALNYYEGDSLLEPSTQQYNTIGVRNAAGEFPLIYYLFGQLWKLIGVSILSTKLVGLLLSLFAVLLSSGVIYKLTKSIKLQTLYVALFFLCPVYTFYSHTLLPNLYSINFLLIAFYLFHRFYEERKLVHYLLFTLFLILSIMIKITVLIALFNILGAILIYTVFWRKTFFKENRKLIGLTSLSFLMAFMGTYLWYSYAIDYNQKHQTWLFSTTIRPIWSIPQNERNAIWKSIFYFQLNGLFHPIILIVVYLGATILGIVKRNALLLLFIGISLIGMTAYFLLWFKALRDHDYYLIELLYLPIILVVYCLNHIELSSNWKTKTIGTVTLLTLILSSTSISQTSYGMKYFYTKISPFIPKIEKGSKWWAHWHHDSHLGALQEVQSELRLLIPENATVFAISDPTPNAHLFLLQRKGYSGFSINNYAGNLNEKLKSVGIKHGDFILNYKDDNNASVINDQKIKLIMDSNNIQVWQYTK